jgi:hypothetical protein
MLRIQSPPYSCDSITDYTIWVVKHTENHFLEIDLGFEWTRTADFLGIDGRDHWGSGLCRAKLGRFDLTDIHEAFMFEYTWQKLKVLVLNSQLNWNLGLVPEPTIN